MSILIGVCGMDLSPWKTTPNSNQFADFLFIIKAKIHEKIKRSFLIPVKAVRWWKLARFFKYFFDHEASFRRIYNGTNLQIFTLKKYRNFTTNIHTNNDFSYVTIFHRHRHNITTHENFEFIHDSSFAKKKSRNAILLDFIVWINNFYKWSSEWVSEWERENLLEMIKSHAFEKLLLILFK